MEFSFRDSLPHNGIGRILLPCFDGYILKHHHLCFKDDVDLDKIIFHLNLPGNGFIAEVLKNDVISARCQ